MQYKGVEVLPEACVQCGGPRTVHDRTFPTCALCRVKASEAIPAPVEKRSDEELIRAGLGDIVYWKNRTTSAELMIATLRQQVADLATVLHECLVSKSATCVSTVALQEMEKYPDFVREELRHVEERLKRQQQQRPPENLGDTVSPPPEEKS